MINCADLQLAYNYLYSELRKYFWSFEAVEALANLETATYRACPDLSEIKHALTQMKYYAYQTLFEDEDLKDAFESFEELLDSDDTTYMKLNKVNEVIQ